MSAPVTEPLDGLRDRDGDGWSDVAEARIGSNPDAYDEPCAFSRYGVKLERRRPGADFVFVLDSSGSMFEELPFLRRGIEDYFGPLLGDDSLDFTVTILAVHAISPDLCLPSSQTDQSCDQRGAPVANERFLFYDYDVRSKNSLDAILETLHEPDFRRLAPNGWYERLRPGVPTVFIELSDDNARLSVTEFEERLRALDHQDHFFDPDTNERSYVWHSIVGFAVPEGLLMKTPEQPVVHQSCRSAPNAGAVYQELSKLTGGLRFPVCQLVDYGGIIERLAQPVFDDGYIPCSFTLPLAREIDEVTNSESLTLQLELGDDGTELLDRVGDASLCNAAGYYLSRTGYGSRQVTLCPELCETIQGAEQARLLVGAGCFPHACYADGGVPTYSGECQ